MNKLDKIYSIAREIWLDSRLSDEEKYNLIFSDKISKQVPFDWYDPDCDYIDDVNAFMNAFDDYMSSDKSDVYKDYYNRLDELD